jgi:radical SAM protein with 4Fe4S-binding SPASM domain
MIDSDLSKRMKAFYVDGGHLLKLHMDLLYACDLDCKHCYLDDKSRSQVSTEAIIDVLEQGAELGALQVLFSGGEIFLRKDLFTILEAAKKLRYDIRLKTHGGRITEDDARRLGALSINKVDFSVYALDDDVHDLFTRREGSLARTLRGIDLLQAHGVPIHVNCPISTENWGYHEQLHQHFRDRGISVHISAWIRGTNGLDTSTYALNVTRDEKIQLELYKMKQDGAPTERDDPPPPEESRLCYAGATLLYIGPNLKVYPCVSFPMECGDLTQSSLQSIWNGSKPLLEVRDATRSDLVGGCGDCQARKACSYCMGVAYVESGGTTWKKPAELTCGQMFVRHDAAEQYKDGIRAEPAVPRPNRKKLMTFNIQTSNLST